MLQRIKKEAPGVAFIRITIRAASGCAGFCRKPPVKLRPEKNLSDQSGSRRKVSIKPTVAAVTLLSSRLAKLTKP
jgi:hypothetical protein